MRQSFFGWGACLNIYSGWHFWWQSILTHCSLIGGGLHQVTFGWLEQSLNEKRLAAFTQWGILSAAARLDILVNTTNRWVSVNVRWHQNRAGSSSSHGEYEDFDWGQVYLLHYGNIISTLPQDRARIKSWSRLHTLPHAYARIKDSKSHCYWCSLHPCRSTASPYSFPLVVGVHALGLLLE